MNKIVLIVSLAALLVLIAVIAYSGLSYYGVI